MGGMFITLEGGEGAGKSTLGNKLAAQLTSLGFEVLATREPGGSALGKNLREILLHRGEMFVSSRAELLLFLADRANHVEEVIRPHLARGGIVLCDRFNDSTMAYQGAAGLDSHAIQPLIDFSTGGLQPDLTLLLDIDPSAGLKRAKGEVSDHMESQSLNYHEKVRQGFKQIARENPTRVVTIDGEKPLEDVFKLAQQTVEERLHAAL